MARTREVKVPDIGDFDAVEVVEVLVSEGDEVAVDDSLINLESDKATMDVPSPAAGVVREIRVEAGGEVKQGDVILVLEEEGEEGEESEEGEEGEEGEEEREEGKAEEDGEEKEEPGETEEAEEREREEREEEEPSEEEGEEAEEREGEDEDEKVEKKEADEGGKEERPERERPAARSGDIDETDPDAVPSFDQAHASPSVRRFAREMAVDLVGVSGTGRKGRITHDDVKAFVKAALSGRAEAAGEAAPAAAGGLPEQPELDYGKWGEVEERELSRIRRAGARNLGRAWLLAPRVTQFDEADVTELEEFRKAQAGAAEERGVKLTLLAFLMKATVAALREHPEFNASLSADGERLILKRYFHLGIAVDTEGGLVVPVVRDVDRKGLFELAEELGDVSSRAREGKLSPDEMRGASFTISSLGGIGGTQFTPIVNVPEVAILGVSRFQVKPVWRDGEFVPRKILPLALSYDHRVIDGAMGARFTSYLARVLSDLRLLLL